MAVVLTEKIAGFINVSINKILVKNWGLKKDLTTVKSEKSCTSLLSNE